MSADLVRFIEARIAEDEAAARHYSVRHWRNVDDYTVANDPGVAGFVKPDAEHGWGVARTATVRDAEFIARHDPARVLRQCGAFRRIVAQAQRVVQSEHPFAGHDRQMASAFAVDTLRALAAIWSDHPEFRQEWAA